MEFRENRVAIYCRLSKDDEQIGDSVSIETQKMLLTSYCTYHNFEIVDIYIDDGYSGLNFNRPSFQRMIDDLENKKFDIVITKDLSRLGRDYIQTGYYIDIYFSSKHIRYIAVNDGIDTLSDNNDIAPFKNILNDMYAKDLSRKVKSAKQQRAKNGLFISSQAPYGYKVDPCNKNKLIVDAESAKVVKYIFELACDGKNYSEISRILETQQIVSPSSYKALNGDTRFIKFTSQEQIYKWPYQTIKSIITNPVYIGSMVNHKVETVNYKTKERVRVPINEQIIVPDTHEAIIDKKVFESINSVLAKRRKPNHKYENIFKGLVYCAECGQEMQLIAKRFKNGTKPMLRCVQHVKNNQICTYNHFVYYDDLFNEIEKQINIQIERFCDSNLFTNLCDEVISEINFRAQKIEKEKLQKEFQIVNKKIKDKYKTLSSNADSNELSTLQNIQRNLLHKITDSSVDFTGNIKNDIENIYLILKKYLQEIAVTQNNLKLLIEKIEIGHLQKTSTNENFQTIKIYYRF